MTDGEHGGGTSTAIRPRATVPGVAEFTLKALVCGLVFGCLFGGANAYIGLQSGLTVSTSIPIAVLSVAIFRLLPRRGTILEANIAQTVGSASSSLASGTIFTIPALFMWGLEPSLSQVAILALCGGLLGILAMVPLRRLLIVQAEAELPYPEGRACAAVLEASQDERGSSGRWIFLGLGLGAALKLATELLHLIPKEVDWPLGQNASLSLAISAALLAVGYIVGFRAAAVMVVGGFITSLVLYPLVTKGYATGVADLLAVENARDALKAYLDRVPEPALEAGAARQRFLLYVGAGAVAAAGLLTVLRTAPTMLRSLAAVVRGVRGPAAGADGQTERTDRDLPGGVLVVGIAFVVVVLAFAPGVLAGELPFQRRVLAALGATAFAFLFVPVSSRLVGVIGVSSNPTSAMALITLAGTAAVFALLGWTELDARAAVLTAGTVVCVAASKAGDISQDLKTGQLVGATPALQQFGQLIAAAVACWAVAFAVLAIAHGQGFTGEGAVSAPQARLMKTIVEAVLGESLPWDLMAMGGALSLSAALVGLPALSFALGIYLPLATLATIFLGGVLRRLAERRGEALQSGVLCASGFVAGEGLAGVLIVGHAWYTKSGRHVAVAPGTLEIVAALLALLAMGAVLYRSARSR